MPSQDSNGLRQSTSVTFRLDQIALLHHSLQLPRRAQVLVTALVRSSIDGRGSLARSSAAFSASVMYEPFMLDSSAPVPIRLKGSSRVVPRHRDPGLSRQHSLPSLST